jgi:hypothetical protein
MTGSRDRPLDGAEIVVGETSNVHPGPPWDTVTVWPAIARVPVRAAPVLGATVTVMEPDPLPEGDDTLSQVCALVADHALGEHSDGLGATVTVKASPAEGEVREVGDTSNLHPGTPSWVTVTVCPAMVTVPVRAGPGLGATVTDSVPAPDPDDFDRLNHVCELEAVHVLGEHPDGLGAIVTVKASPAEGEVREVGDTANSQGGTLEKEIESR